MNSVTRNSRIVNTHDLTIDKNDMAKIHSFFLTNHVMSPSYLLKEKEIQSYYNTIDSSQRNFFTSSGHLLVGIHCKHLYKTKTISQAIDIVSLFLKSPFSPSQKKNIQTNIKLIFSNNSSRVKEITGGAKLDVFLIFSCIYIFLQSMWYYCHINYYKAELVNVVKDMNQTVYNVDKTFETVFSTSLKEVYGELSNVPVEKVWINSFVNSIAPVIVEKSVYSSPQFQQDVQMFVRFYTVLSSGFSQFIVKPSTDMTDLLTSTVLKKKNIAVEKELRKELQSRQEKLKSQSAMQKSYFDEKRMHFTVTKQKEITKEMKSFQNAIDQLNDIINSNSPGTTLVNNPKVTELLESMGNIADILDDYKGKLEDSLDNLSDSKEISLVYESDTNAGMKKEDLQLKNVLYEMSGVKALDKINRVVSDQMNALYNTYVSPLVQSFEDIKKSLNLIIGTINMTVKNVRSVVSTIRDLNYNEKELTNVIKGLPTQFTLIMSMFYRLYSIIPGLLRYIGGVVSILSAFIYKLAKKIKNSKSRTQKTGRRIVNNRKSVRRYSPVSSPRLPSRSRSRSRSKTPTRSKSKSKTPTRSRSRSRSRSPSNSKSNPKSKTKTPDSFNKKIPKFPQKEFVFPLSTQKYSE